MYTSITAAVAAEHRNALLNEAAEDRRVRTLRPAHPVSARRTRRRGLLSGFRAWLAAGQL